MDSKATPTPWRWTDEFTTFDNEPTWSIVGADGYGILSCDVPNSPQETNPANADFLLRAVNAHDDLVAVVREFAAAEAMELYPTIEWEWPKSIVRPEFGGGDCEKHGRWYGHCVSCADAYKRASEDAHRDACTKRDAAFRNAAIKARAALAKATGETP